MKDAIAAFSCHQDSKTPRVTQKKLNILGFSYKFPVFFR